MNNKIIAIVVLIMLVGIGMLAWRGYGSAMARIDAQKASIYEVTGESWDE